MAKEATGAKGAIAAERDREIVQARWGHTQQAYQERTIIDNIRTMRNTKSKSVTRRACLVIYLNDRFDATVEECFLFTYSHSAVR